LGEEHSPADAPLNPVVSFRHMRFIYNLSLIAIAATAFAQSKPAASKVPLYQQFMSPASPQELSAAKKADRVAWVDYAEGRRNAYTAAGPLFAPSA
jgi:hypothetical protein